MHLIIIGLLSERSKLMTVTLKNLVNRINLDKKFLARHPEHKEMLERRIANTERLIIECVMTNGNNSALGAIGLK